MLYTINKNKKNQYQAMKITVCTLFPQYFSSILSTSVLGKAIAEGLVEVKLVHIRDFATDKHKVTDDRPYGGGAGMVLKPEPIVAALESIPERASAHTILFSASGKKFTQASACEYVKNQHLILICGHYEGVDERVVEYVDEEIRIGEYVLTGGEPAAAVVIDAVARLHPGVLGNPESLQGESFSENDNGAYPQYTRPEDFRGSKVPQVLLEGHHAKITQWRESQRKTIK